MKVISHIIFENERGEFLAYLRDNVPHIPFPHHWDLIGGHVDEGETPVEALIRETKEEIDFDLTDFKFWKTYECLEGDVYPNIKHIYVGKINKELSEINLLEGEKLSFFKPEEVDNVNFANILKRIVLDYIKEKH